VKIETVLSVQDLRLVFETIQGRFHALNGVDLEIKEREVVGLVGESGSGKSSLALATIGLLPTPPARILAESQIHFKGQDLLALKEDEMEKIRGTGISMIFQEPLTSLDPLFTIGDQVEESVKIGLERRGKSGNPVSMDEQVEGNSASWLKRVGLPDPERALQKYPHELSGGMRQRVMIAMAMAAKPSLMLADEPTSALDVTTQAQILKLTRSLMEEVGTAVLFISHDLAVVAQIADRVLVMYAGMIVEEAPVHEIFDRPLHPYTQALLASFPTEEAKGKHLGAIPGYVPSLANIPDGCPFHPRCKYAREDCPKARPGLREIYPGHKVACVLY
jgi:oligopeptide/dipeptide ABC transporter ATP-binding protein